MCAWICAPIFLSISVFALLPLSLYMYTVVCGCTPSLSLSPSVMLDPPRSLLFLLHLSMSPSSLHRFVFGPLVCLPSSCQVQATTPSSAHSSPLSVVIATAVMILMVSWVITALSMMMQRDTAAQCSVANCDEL